jgi:hypothetical protein
VGHIAGIGEWAVMLVLEVLPAALHISFYDLPGGKGAIPGCLCEAPVVGICVGRKDR